MNVQMGMWLYIDVVGEHSRRDHRQVVVIDRNGLCVLALDTDGQVITWTGP